MRYWISFINPDFLIRGNEKFLTRKDIINRL